MSDVACGPMTFRLDPELAVRWQRLAERQRENLLAIREKRPRFGNPELEALISGAERNIAGWAALAGGRNSGDDVGRADIRLADEYDTAQERGEVRSVANPDCSRTEQLPGTPVDVTEHSEPESSEELPCDELSAPKVDPRHLSARLAADPQEAVAALGCNTDGRRQHHWPAFLNVQPQPDPSPLRTERLKGFEDVQEAVAALGCNADGRREASLARLP
jgi:hypothetical protein